MTNTTAAQPLDLDKEAWIARAVAKLLRYMPDHTREYAEELYREYVTDFGDVYADDPEGAVKEDMSYWGD